MTASLPRPHGTGACCGALLLIAVFAVAAACGPDAPQQAEPEGTADATVEPAAGGSASSAGADPTAARDPRAPWWEDDVFPELGPFGASRMTKILEKPGDDLAAAAKAIRELGTSAGMGALSAKEATDALLAGEDLDPEQLEALRQVVDGGAGANGPSAELSPAFTLSERMRWTTFTMALALAEPLWSVTDWDADAVELGTALAEMTKALPNAPDVSFAEGAPEANAAALAHVSRFLRDAVVEDRVVAALIFTMDDGPYVGLPVPDGSALSVVRSVALRDDLVLELCRRDGDDVAEPFVARCRRGDEIVFARVLSQAPDGDLVHVELVDREPTRIGSYGWKIHLMTEGPGGHEYAHLYVASDGSLRFYFVSW